MITIESPRVRTPYVTEEMLSLMLDSRRELLVETAVDMVKNIKPAVRKSDGKLFYIEAVNPVSTTFLSDPHFTKEVTDVVELQRIFTLHTCGYCGIFKPSISEVLMMIPPTAVSKVKAFEVIGPEDSEDLVRQRRATDAGYHVAITVLYRTA